MRNYSSTFSTGVSDFGICHLSPDYFVLLSAYGVFAHLQHHCQYSLIYLPRVFQSPAFAI